jgi:hypothetical protein
MCLFLTTGVRADPIPVATQGFVDLGTTLANGSATGNINAATTFTIAAWISNNNNSGVLSGMPPQTFVSFSFDITNPASLTFGNSVFGTFMATALTGYTNSLLGSVGTTWLGQWTPGTFAEGMGVTGGPFASDISLSYAQSPPGTGFISANAIFSTPTVIPEPSSIVLALTALAAGLVSYRLRRPSGQSRRRIS